ncbi:MAG: hypothetical protein ACRC5W_09370 [Cetobacterium sp.]|uniref:hypothetical protein n=1 Tax=Cetobacterium sp. TaxID=2071632 RepID=UPI003F2DF14C
MKKILLGISVLLSANIFAADFKSDKGIMNFNDLKIEKVESTTYISLTSKSGEAYLFGLANDVILDVKNGKNQKEVIGFYDSIEENKLEVELYDISLANGTLNIKPTYEDFNIQFTKDESNKIFKTVMEVK